MKFERMKSFTGPLICCVGIAALVIGLATEAPAQARPNAPQPTPGTVTNPDMHDREANITLMERGKDEAKSRDAALKQMNEDFQRIQTLSLDLTNLLSPGNQPDYKKVSEDASDIRTRASRLKANLVLPPSAKQEKPKKEPDAGKMNLAASVSAVSDSIKSFVNNPIFQRRSQQPPDAQDVAKARLDLDQVIRLSSQISKEADKLNKSGGTSN